MSEDFTSLIEEIGLPDDKEFEERIEEMECEIVDETEIPSFSYEQIIQTSPYAEGNPFGSVAEKLQFLRWIIQNPVARHGNGGIFLKTSVDNLKYQVSNEYVQNETDMSDATRRRINQLRKRAGYVVFPINRYFREYVNAKSATTITDYSRAKDGLILAPSVVRTTGNMVRRNSMKTFKGWMKKSEYNKIKRSLEENKEKALEKSNMRDYWKERCINNVFLLIDGGEFKEIGNRPTTEIEYKAINKLKGKPKYFTTRCPACNSLMKFPLCPNIEEDKYERLAYGLYMAGINQCNGLCKKCIDNVWKEEEIIELLSKLELGNKAFAIPLGKFCESFRKDGAVIEITEVIKIVGKMCKKASLDMRIKPYQEDDGSLSMLVW